MALSQKSVPTLETEASLLKSWDFTSTKHTNLRSLNERKKSYKFLEMSDQKARKDVLPLVCITDDLDNKEHLEDLSSNFETDRRFNIDEELSLKQSPMPYLYYSKEKRIFHTPFKWVFNQAQAQQINTESFYVIKEVAISNASTKQGERSYQVQPNGQKIEEIQEQIEVAFQLYWKLTMYHRIRTNFSVEINKLHKALQEISPKISIEREYIYDANSYILFTNNNIDEQIYNDYKNLLEPIIGTKMIPVLAKLKKELYAMEYLSGEHQDIHAKLDILLKNLNQTIAVAGIMKKNADKKSRLSSLNLQAALKLEKMQNPHELYKSFQEIAVRIQSLTSDLNRFSKLRVGFRTYLKIAVILDIYLPQENKLKELKKKLFVINEQLTHKAQYFKVKGYLRRIGSISAGTEYFIEEFDVNFKSLFEGNQCLEQNMVAEMKDHMQRVQKFVSLAEIFCGEIKTTKDHVKVFKMHNDSIVYLQQVEQITRGIHLAKEIKEELEPILEEEDDALLQEDLMRKIEHEYRDLALQVRLSNFSTDNKNWSSPKIATAFIQALEQELQVKRGKKGEAKAIAFGKRKMLSKLAKIVRRRIKEMNRIYISCRGRINSHIRIKDAIEFLKSKRLWRALSSDKSCILSVQGNIEGCKKAVNHKIYCNAELEMNLMKIIRVFVFFLANVMPTI